MKTEIDNTNSLVLSGLNNPELCEGYQGSQSSQKAHSTEWAFCILRPVKWPRLAVIQTACAVQIRSCGFVLYGCRNITQSDVARGILCDKNVMNVFARSIYAAHPRQLRCAKQLSCRFVRPLQLATKWRTMGKVTVKSSFRTTSRLVLTVVTD